MEKKDVQNSHRLGKTKAYSDPVSAMAISSADRADARQQSALRNIFKAIAQIAGYEIKEPAKLAKIRR